MQLTEACTCSLAGCTKTLNQQVSGPLKNSQIVLLLKAAEDVEINAVCPYPYDVNMVDETDKMPA